MRDYDATAIAALGEAGTRLVMFIELAFDGQTARYCTAGTDIDWNSVTWSGLGSVLSVDPIRHTNRVEAVGWKIGLSGVPTSLLSLAASTPVLGRRASAWIGAYNEAGALIYTPRKAIEASMSHFDIEDQPQNAQVVLSIESKIIRLMQPNGALWTDAEQRRRNPNDQGMKFISITAERTLAYGPRQ
jgi:hypothetical protein